MSDDDWNQVPIPHFPQENRWVTFASHNLSSQPISQASLEDTWVCESMHIALTSFRERQDMEHNKQSGVL